uniref:MFS transporter n=1 Tax=Cyberlindnera americana TaxID=36016 RepID=A0A5P8N8N0_9ASCO|nr:MFS transporter [Cyberlindnera americana]
MSSSVSSHSLPLEKSAVQVEATEILEFQVGETEVIKTGKKAVDEAFQFLEGKDCSYSIEEERRVVRKIDSRILPLLFLLYCVQFADKVSLGYAALMGIRDDTHLDSSSQQYSWVSSIFYAGYIFWEFPTAYFLNKFPIARYTSFNIMAWGIILACTCGAKNYGGLLILRFLLGMFEATITPAFVLITAVWYKRDEQAKRMGIWLAANGVATLITSPIAYGLYHVHNAHIKSWMILFMMFGIITVFTGVLFYFFLPDNQLNAKFLSEKEKIIAIDRVRSNFQGVGSSTWKWYQVREAFVDPRTYLYIAFSLLMNIPNGGVTTFGSIIIKSFGFQNERALLLSMPGGAVDLVFKLTVPWISDKMMDRSLPAMFAIAFPMIGGIMMSVIPVHDKVPLLVGYYFISAAGASWGLVMSMIAANTVGSTKKTVVNSLQIIAYGAGNWIGPQTFRSKESPNYPTGKKLVGILYGCALGSLIVIRVVNIMENRRRDKLEAEGKIPPMLHNEEFLDRTDFEQLHHRYIL